MKLLETRAAEREEITNAIDAITDAAVSEERDLTEAEETNLGELHTRAKELDGQIENLVEIRNANDKAAEVRSAIGSRPAGVGDDKGDGAGKGRVTVKSEPRMYAPEADTSFMRDVYLSQIHNDQGAADRLARHGAEVIAEGEFVGGPRELRASDTSNFAGLTVPKYLTDMYAPLVRAGRPTANLCNRHNLPAKGNTLEISRLTTGSSAAAQAAENDPVSKTDPDDTVLTVNVRTYAGAVDLSRQSVERGEGVDELTVQDQMVAYATSLNSGIISGAGTSGTHLGILNTGGHGDIDQDDASPTAHETFVQIVKALTWVGENRLLPADVILMHPRRWGYIYGGLDGQNRPLVEPTPGLAFNPIGVGDPAAAPGQVVGQIAGVPIALDPTIPTNLGTGTDEDRIIVARRADMHLWEENDGVPRSMRIESVAAAGQTYDDETLTIRSTVYGYSAFSSGRYPTGVAIIQGSLLAATL